MTAAHTHPSQDQNNLLASFVQGRNVPCPGCGYNLRNTTAPACPECGQGLVLSVGTLSPRVGAWALALVSAALPVGFAGTFAAIAIVHWQRTSYWGGNDTFEAMLFAIAACAWLVITGVVYRLRGRFARWSVRVRWLVAVAVFLAAAGSNAGVILAM